MSAFCVKNGRKSCWKKWQKNGRKMRDHRFQINRPRGLKNHHRISGQDDFYQVRQPINFHVKESTLLPGSIKWYGYLFYAYRVSIELTSQAYPQCTATTATTTADSVDHVTPFHDAPLLRCVLPTAGPRARPSLREVPPRFCVHMCWQPHKANGPGHCHWQ